MKTPRVPYFDVRRQYEAYRSDFEQAVRSVLASGTYILSRPVQEFEAAFSAYCGGEFGVGVGSGTDALTFSLKALGIGKGDEVILPAFTFMATAFAVMHVGATPVFADIDECTYTLNPDSVARMITRKTKVVIPVHLYGHPVDMDALRRVIGRKIAIVEDACQGHGAAWKGKRVGGFGAAGCFSFYPTKNLGACGDGGMVVTSKASVAKAVQRSRNLGRLGNQGPHGELGWTSRLDALQAALLLVKLKRLESFIENRRRVARFYSQCLNRSPLALPVEAPNARHVYHLYVVRVPQGRRDALQAWLAKHGIPTLIHYKIPIHRQPVYTRVFSRRWKLPVTENHSREILSLPIFPEMKEAEVRMVCDAVARFFGIRQAP